MDKYTKCYGCKEAEQVYKTLVAVSADCPKKIRLNNGYVVSKKMCESCEHIISKEKE
ncbi:hypothetical protein [Ruminiclostridium papyrosolvens]|uniref:Uncharacterized protein n=1 Tax=Ruminiclostridium papyrosolvens C7 TaxID=1330534 RepID=U4R058_9FIRM|nr:hypothetical protein [Ruminiclostridium papyrosolvens]EPR10129.1 hypothetical protein L323_14925 [Ruminiclostridium papyrosolvens C7]